MTDHVILTHAGKRYRLPLVTGSEGEQAIDISRLRAETGLITLDTGFANTGSCRSAITYLDGEKGILRYRGIPVEQLAERSTFKETAYLLINMFTVMFAIGRLPGWIAQWKESMDDPDWKLCRPRQVYTGPNERPYVPIEERRG